MEEKQGSGGKGLNRIKLQSVGNVTLHTIFGYYVNKGGGCVHVT